MMPAVYVRSPHRPFPVIGWPKAFDVERGFTLMERSQASFSVSRSDPALTASIMAPGNIVEITGANARSWVGVLKAPEESFDGDAEHWTCEDFLTQMDECLMPASWNYDLAVGASIAWTDIYNESTRGRRVVPDLLTVFGPGPPIVHDFSNSTALAAMNDLAQSVGWEFEVTSQRRPFRVSLNFREHIGVNRTQSVRITNAHIISGNYIIDPKGQPASVRTVGADSSFELARGVAPPLGTGADTVTTGGWMPPTLQERRAVLDVSAAGQTGLRAVALNELTTPRYGTQRIEADLNMLLSWSSFDVGDYVIGVFAGLRHGGVVEGVFRVTGLQPSEERGMMSAVLEDQTIWQ